MKKAAVVYQFCILMALIGLTVYFAIVNKELNDTLIGALIGVMIGLPIRSDVSETNTKKVEGKKDESIY